MSLRARFMLLVVAAVAPAFVLIGYMGVAQREQAAQSAEKDAASLVRVAAREQQLLIASTRQLLTGVARLAEIRPPSVGTCARFMGELRQVFPYFANLGAASPTGDIYCSAVPLARPVNIADRSYFRRAVESRAFAAGNYQTGRVTGTTSINFGYPVYNAGHELLAVVYAALDLSWLEQLMRRAELPSGSTLMVTDSSGTILARLPEAHRWVGKSLTARPLIRALLARPGEGTAALEGLDGDTRLFAFAPLNGDDEGSAYISVGIPKAVAFASADGVFSRSLILLVVSALLALAAAWVGSNVFVLRRVHALAAAVTRLARGDMSARSGLPHGNKDLGSLARSIDDMASALQRLTRAHKTLSAGNRSLVRATDEQTLLDRMCQVIVNVGGYPLAWVGVAEKDEARSIRPVAQAGHDGGLQGLIREMGPITWRDGERGQGPAATAIRTGELRVVRDVLSNSGMAPWHTASRERHHAAAAAFPLRVDGSVVGVLVMYAHDQDAFDAEEMNLLEESAEDLAFGIASLRTRAAHDQAHRTIERMAYYDRLTGLPNHSHFEERLQQRLAGAPTTPAAVLLLGINRFGEINEALGFNEGDALLRVLGERVATAVKPGGFIARLRGDEFAALVTGGAEEARAAAQAILACLDAPFLLGGIAVDVTVAIGIALHPQHGHDVKSLIQRADIAMQLAKRSGEASAFYAAEHERDTAQRLVMARALRRALEEEQLVLYYQPKVRMEDRRVCGLEALIRWNHPERGLVAPGTFIPLAEHTGLIRPLTDWALGAALRQAAEWRALGLDFPIAVNLSARNLQDPELLAKVQRLLAASGADAGWLELEITESVIMENIDEIVSKLRALKALGLAVSVDDFGTGYSSLAYLANLPLDAVKIDRTFISKVHESTESRNIVSTIISLAHSLDLRVVAEGVEEEAQARTLQKLKCDEMQGFLFSKPRPAEEIATLLRDGAGRRSRA